MINRLNADGSISFIPRDPRNSEYRAWLAVEGKTHAEAEAEAEADERQRATDAATARALRATDALNRAQRIATGRATVQDIEALAALLAQ